MTSAQEQSYSIADSNRSLPINQILQGDCLELMKQLPDKCVDLLLTDPPYGVNLEYETYEDTEENWFNMMDKAIPEMRRVAKMVIFPACQIARFDWHYARHKPDWLIVWYKGSPGQRSYIGFNDWEMHVVYGKTKKIMHDYFALSSTERMGAYGHPCPKPVGWAEWFIEHATNEGAIILDTFTGSGTTLVAAEKLNRRWIGMEINPEYVKIAQDRVAKVQNQDRLTSFIE